MNYEGVRVIDEELTLQTLYIYQLPLLGAMDSASSRKADGRGIDSGREQNV